MLFNNSESKMTIHPIPYNKEMVEHLTDQLVKLQRSYDSTSGISSKVEIERAMKTVNEALSKYLLPTPSAIISFPKDGLMRWNNSNQL